MCPSFGTIVVAALKKLPKHMHISGVGVAAAVGGSGVKEVISESYGPQIYGASSASSVIYNVAHLAGYMKVVLIVRLYDQH